MLHRIAPFFLCLAAQASAEPLKDVLARMDQSAAAFRGMSGNIRRLTHTAVLKENNEESGTVAMKKSGPRDVRMLIEFSKPDVKAVAFQDRKAQIFYPKIKTVQIYDFGRQGALVDQFLLLGFGTSGRELEKNYSLKVLGEETVAGQKTSRLELIPKSDKVRENFNRFELWISEAGHPVQQKLYQPSGDYNLVTYTDLKLNPGLGDDALSLKLPKDVVKEYPNK
jgi:outer membrane lipoprotein-sorting protein